VSLHKGLAIGIPISLLIWFGLIGLVLLLVGCATQPPMRVPDVVEIEVPVPVMAPFGCQCQCQPHKELEIEVDETDKWQGEMEYKSEIPPWQDF